MSSKESSRKPLVIGIIAAVVILAALLVVLLTQCVGGNTAETVDPNATASTSAEVPTYELYWNVDRAEYDGKSEAGMSSRMPESDGYFRVRFILDGQEVVLKVQDRKLINAIDVQDLMGLEFDENGVVVGVLALDDMPLEKLGWQFYVQSAAKTLIKLNSSESMNGMEVLLETDENTGVYDMTGKSGPVGVVTDPINMDRVYAIANLAGEVTHVFIYQRPNYMLTHEAECQHCKKTVTWYEWVKEDEVPVTTGHYQLQNNIQLKKQPAQQEDAKICLDLNGVRVDGASGARVYAMFNAGTELAIMDTSEGQTGRMAAHGKGDQGMVVWVRYGALYLYGGTLDASDATTRLTGTAIDCGKGKYFYMYGGTIIGGTAEPQKNDKGKWTQGLGGTMSLGGKFVMNGGEIRGGNAKAVITKRDANGDPSAYERGIGGSIYMSSSAVFEMNGGTISGGKAGNIGGNIYMDGAAELTINGGTIKGGTITGKGKNGGNIFAGSKTTITQNGGSIIGGTSRNCAGNVYTNGKYVMNGGTISGGVIRDFKTGKVQANASSANVFVVNGKFHMYGGRVDGLFQAIDTSATDKAETTLVLSGYATIDGGEKCTRNLTLSGKVTVYVGNMYDSARVGVYTTNGVFTEPTKESNKDNFFSDVEGADIVYWDGCLALGRVRCICGKSTDSVTSEEHINGCTGELHLWAPWTSTSSVPTTSGKYYMLKDVTTTGQTTMGNKGIIETVMLDTNGHNVTLKVGTGATDGFRLYRVDQGSTLIITDTAEKVGTFKTVVPAAGTKFTGKILKETVKDEETGEETKIYYEAAEAQAMAEEYWANGNFGMLLWGRGGNIVIHNGNFDGSNLSGNKTGMVASISNLTVTDAETGEKTVYQGSLTMHGGKITGGTSRANGSIEIAGGATFNLHGGEITGGRVDRSAEEVDGGAGGNIYLSGTMNMTGGKVTNGYCRGGTKGGGHGGNIFVAGTLNATGGEISGGDALNGGNVATNSSGAKIYLKGVTLSDGYAANAGGNLAVVVRSCKAVEITDGTKIVNGTAKMGGNVGAHIWAGNSQDLNIIVDNATISDGEAVYTSGDTGFGGNFYLKNTSSGEKASAQILTLRNGAVVENGFGIRGGNIWMEKTTVNVEDATVADGGAHHASGYGQGGNIYVSNATCVVNLGDKALITGGSSTSKNGTWSPGGNFYVNAGVVNVEKGAVVEAGNAFTQGNNFYINGSATVNLNGGEIRNTVAKNESILMQGGKLFVNSGKMTAVNGSRNLRTNMDGGIAEITINGGEIIGAEYSGSGANLYLSGKSKTVMNGGTITGGNSLTGQAGNVMLTAETKDSVAYYATFEMNGGTISGGISKYNGANVCVPGGTTFVLNGGTVTGGNCADSGGNFYVNGMLEINGGLVEKGVAKNTGAANVFVVNGSTKLTGGEVKGNFSVINTNASKNACSVEISGKPVISVSDNGVGLSLSAGGDTAYMPQITITGELEKDAQIYTSALGHISKETVEANTKAFHSVVADTAVMYDQNRVFIGKAYCLCGGDASWCDHEKLAWAPYSSAISVDGYKPSWYLTAGGNYYLTAAVTGKGQVSVNNTAIPEYTVNIDLNGFTWTANGRSFLVQNNKTLGITDTKGGGILYNGGNSKNCGGFLMQGGTTLNLYGGTITMKTNPTVCTGGGNIELSGATMNMYDGVVKGGIAASGGNIIVTSTSKLYMHGGEITGGIAGYGGNIHNKGTVEITGGKVTNGAAYGKAVNATFTNTYGQGGNIYNSGSAAKLIVKGKDTEISGGVSSSNTWSPGGNIYTNAGAQVTLDEGAKVFGGMATDGHNIYMTGESTKVNLKNTTIKNASSTTSANIAVESGTLTVDGATIVNEASNSRNIVTNDSTYEVTKDGVKTVVQHVANIVINSGTISGGTFNGNGGNIGIMTADTLTVNGGTIIGGSTTDSGGNIAVYGTMNMNGGLVTDGKCGNPGNGMNISVIKAKDIHAAALNITGGTIAGGLHFNNAVGAVNISISGTPVIDKELSTANKATYSMKLSNNDLTIGELKTGSKIMVSGDEGIFSYAAPEGADQFFHSEVEGMAVWQIDGELVLVYGRNSCVCGVNSDNPDDHIGDCDGTKHNWLPVTEIPSTSGYYYLISNVTDSGAQRQIKTAEDIYLDLNGKTVNCTKFRMYWLQSSAKLTITDNSANGGGTIKVTGSRDQGSVVWLSGGNVFTMYDGIIDTTGASVPEEKALSGLSVAGGLQKLYGGTIKGGTMGGANYGGAGTSLEGGKTHILGDVEITAVSGSALYITNNTKLDMTYAVAPETPWTVDAGGIFTENWNPDWEISDYFVSGSTSGAQIYLDEATGELTMGKYYCVCGVDSANAADHKGDCNGEKLYWTGWFNSESLPKTTGNYYLTRDILGVKNSTTGAYTLKQTEITSSTKQVVRWDLNGYDVNCTLGNRLVLLQNSNELVITDVKGGGTVYGGGQADNGGIILTQGTSVCSIYGGNFTLQDDATVCTHGSLIDVSGKELNIHGGNLTINKISSGGILVRDKKLFNMTGGKIQITAESAAVTNAITLWGGATFTMTGGEIVNTGKNCRNIRTDGTIDLRGGTISGTDVTVSGTNGGSIYVSTKGTLNMSGGSIIGGKVSNQGGNVGLYGKLIMTGGTIKDGISAGKDNYNITAIGGSAQLDIRGGTIAGGVLVNNGADTGKPTVKLSGKPVIDVNKTSASVTKPSCGINLGGSSQLLDVTGLTGGEIHVRATVAGQFAKNATSGMEKHFVSETVIDGVTLPVCYADNGLYFGQVYCLCGYTKEGSTLTAHEYWCDGEDHIWLPFAQDHILTSGYFYLTDDISRTYQTCIGEIDAAKDEDDFAVDAVIDLNGKTWRTTGRAFRLEKGSLSVTDTVGGSKVIGGGTGDQSGVLLLGNNTTVNLYKGDWALTDGKSAGKSAGVLEVYTGATVNMYSGTISGGNAVGDGGNVSVTAGSFNFYGGVIAGGNAANGGNVRVTGGSFNMIPSPLDTKGVATRIITGGTATNGGNVSVTGGSFTMEDSQIGGTVTVEKVSIVDGAVKVEEIEVSGGKATENGGHFYITGGTVTVDGSTVTGGQAVNGGNFAISGGSLVIDGATVEKGSAISTASHAYGGNIYASSSAYVELIDATVTEGLANAPGTVGNVTYYAYGGNIHMRNSSSLVAKDGTVISEGTSDSSGKWSPGGNIYLVNSATAELNDTTVEGGAATEAGNLYISTGTTITLNDSKILNTKNQHSIVMQAGTLYINDSEIISTASNARNIYHNGEPANDDTKKAYIYFNGGKISGARLEDNDGANLVLKKNGIMVMTDGEISDGEIIDSYTTGTNSNGQTTYTPKGSKGANVFLGSGATFTMKDGLISGGTVDCTGNKGDCGYGGSIRVEGTFTMEGGKVTGGYVRNGASGGGLGGNFGVAGTLIITGGTVEKGDATTGGNIGSNSSGAVIRISGATIQEGYASGVGGNLAINTRNIKEFTVNGDAKILNGEAGNNGGNIAINVGNSGATPAYSMTLNNVSVKDGVAGNYGGNIYVRGVSAYKSTIHITDSTITGGTGTASEVGGVYLLDDNSGITLNGKVVIDGNNGKNLRLGGNTVGVTVETLTAGSKIGLSATCDRVITNVVDAAEKAYFVCEDADRSLSVIEDGAEKDMLYYGCYNCICGGTATEGACADGGHVKVRWTAWDGTVGGITASGNYYLTTDYTIPDGTQIGVANTAARSTISVNLNGHTLSAKLRAFQMRNAAEGTLNLADHKGGGKILAPGVSASFGIVQIVNSKNTINVYSGYYGMMEGHGTAASVSLFGIYSTGSVMNVYNATMEGDTKAITGPLIEIGSGATVNLHKGSLVKNGHATNQGGNFRVLGGGTLRITGGTIQDGKSVDCAGNIYANGLVIMEDGLVTNGRKATTGGATGTLTDNGNIYLVNGDLTMSGGTIDGLNACNTAANGCDINISGTAKITDKDGFGFSLINWASAGNTPPATPIIKVGALDKTASIVIRGQLDKVFATGTADLYDYKANFKSHDGYQTICTEEGLKMIDANAHAHCECSGIRADDDTHTCVDIIYTPMTASDVDLQPSPADGKFEANFYLVDDLSTGDSPIYLRHDTHVRICLNGHTLTSNTRTISMFCDGTTTTTSDGNTVAASCHSAVNPNSEKLGETVLVLTTCEKGGTVTTKAKKADVGRALWVRYGDATVYGVNLQVNTITNNPDNKSGVALGVSSGKATLYDATITGGFATDTNLGLGSAIAVDTKGKLFINGSLTLNTGDAQQLYVIEGGIVDITGLESVNGPISVNASGTFTKGYSACTYKDKANLFTPWVKDMDIFVSNNELFVGKQACYCGATNGNHTDGCIAASGVETAAEVKPILWKAWRTTNNLPTTGNYVLVTNVNQLSSEAPVNLALDLNGYTISNDGRANNTYSRVFSFNGKNGSKLVVVDHSAKKTGKVYATTGTTTANTNQGALIWLSGTGSVNNKIYLLGGTWDASTFSAKECGAIYFENQTDNNLLYIENTTIKGAKLGGTGNSQGSVIQFNAESSSGNKIIMNSGELIGSGSGINGGGVVLLKGSATQGKVVNEFVMNGGTITGCEVSGSGGAVYVHNTKFVMNGGTIEGGTAGAKGGAVYITTDGKFIMNGGTIQNGTATTNGGNISLFSTGRLEICGENAQIKNGVCANGGNIYATYFTTGNTPTFIMSGGTITGGSCGEGKPMDGANLALVGVLNATISGGTIEGYALMDSRGSTAPTVTLSGNAKITAGTDGNGLVMANTGSKKCVLALGNLTDDASIAFNVAAANYAADDVVITGMTNANTTKVHLNTTNWEFLINTSTSEATLIAK